MFWQNCFSVHLNFLFPSLGSGSLSNYSWEVNKYLVSCQTQEVLQIGNCFFSAKILVLFAMLSEIFLLFYHSSAGLPTVKPNSSRHDHFSPWHAVHDTMTPLTRVRMLLARVLASDWQHRGMRPGPADGLGGERPVIWWHCTAVHCSTPVHCTAHPPGPRCTI